MQILFSDSAVVCPRGKAGTEPLIIDLESAFKTEARLDEVAIVTPNKAPELLALFNRACLDLNRQSTMLVLEHQNALREANRIRGEILLDQVPGILAKKGLAKSSQPAGSEDLRNAILSVDPVYQGQLEVIDQIKCVIELIKGKYESFERAFTSVKKIMGESSYNYGGNSNLNGNSSALPVGAEPKSVTISTGKITGFGKAKYDSSL